MNLAMYELSNEIHSNKSNELVFIQQSRALLRWLNVSVLKCGVKLCNDFQNMNHFLLMNKHKT